MSTALGNVFWSHVQPTLFGCWEWTGPIVNGYGHHGGTTAHRVMWMDVNGPIPDGMVIDHVCQTTICVNPDHLRLTNHSGNGHHRKGTMTTNSSGYTGVWKVNHRWRAFLTVEGRRIHIGYYATAEEAHVAVEAARRALAAIPSRTEMARAAM